MHKAKKSTWIIIGIMMAGALGAPLIAGPKNNYMMNILISYCYFGILAASLNLLIGYTGQMSLGHAAFMAIGGYAYAILNKTLVYRPCLLEAFDDFPGHDDVGLCESRDDHHHQRKMADRRSQWFYGHSEAYGFRPQIQQF